MSFGPVQSLGATGAVITLPNNVVGGNTIIFACTTSPISGSPTVSVSDNHGNSYTLATTKTGSGSYLWVFYLLNATAGSNVITATYSGGALTIDSCMAREYTAAYASALDKTSSNYYSGAPQTTATSGATSTLSQALETVIGICSSFSSVTMTAGTNFGNLLEQTDGTIASLAMEDQPVDSTTGIAATFVTSLISSYQCVVLTFLSTYVPGSGGGSSSSSVSSGSSLSSNNSTSSISSLSSQSSVSGISSGSNSSTSSISSAKSTSSQSSNSITSSNSSISSQSSVSSISSGSNSSVSSISSQSSGSSSSAIVSLILQAPLFFVDLVIDSVNSNKVTSNSYQFTNAMIGQIFNITSGTNFTTQTTTIDNVVSGALILTTSAGTVSSIGGAGNLAMIPCVNSIARYQSTAGMSIDGNNYRYLGSVLTNSSNQIYNFSWLTSGNTGRVYYESNTLTSPFGILNGTTYGVSSGTAVSCASVVPPSSIVALSTIQPLNDLETDIYIGKPNGVIPSNTSGSIIVSGVYGFFFFNELPLDNFQSFIWAATTSANQSMILSCLGYIENR